MPTRSPSVTRMDTTSALVCSPMTVMHSVRPRSASSPVLWSACRCVSMALTQVEFAQELDVAVNALEHGIDDQRLAAMPAREQIGVGAGGLVEQLAEDHGLFRMLPPRSSSKIVHVGVGCEAPFVGEGIVDQALGAGELQARGRERRGQLRRRHEALPLVGTDRKPAQDELGADN